MENLGALDSLGLFPKHSIKILIIDDEPALVDLYFEHLSLYELYDVSCAYNARSADLILSSAKRIHVSIMDLGLYDIQNDEYFLIKKYSPRISFIIATARDTLEKGFQAKDCGAITALNKPVNFYQPDVFNFINEAFIRSLICPEHIENCKTIIRDAVKIFIYSKPKTIRAWTNKIRIEERYFRKVWIDCFGYQPKHIVWLYRMFSSAFSYCNFRYFDKFSHKIRAPDLRLNEDINFNKRFAGYYKKHFKEIDRILTS